MSLTTESSDRQGGILTTGSLLGMLQNERWIKQWQKNGRKDKEDRRALTVAGGRGGGGGGG